MSDVVSMQWEEPDMPEEEKASNVSYMACNNSYQSQAWCWRF